jgi:hypothetical protein
MKRRRSLWQNRQMAWHGALVGTVIGGLIGIAGSLSTFFVQQWVRTRGDVNINASDWNLTRQAEFSAREETITDPRTLEDNSYLTYKTALRIHNQKDVSVGLLELCLTFHEGQEKQMELRPDAGIRYMGIQDPQKQNPFEAATLPGQEVVVIWVSGKIGGPENIAKFRRCSRVNLRARLSGEARPRRLKFAEYD